MTDAILVLNAGSSSIKFSVFGLTADESLSLLSKGRIEGIGTRAHLKAVDAAGATLADHAYDPGAIGGHDEALRRLGEWLSGRLADASVVAVGHRVVHGGPDFAAPAVVHDALIAALEALVPLAPLHQPSNLAGIRAVRAYAPSLPQVACFDTAFHRGHPELADRFAIPDALYRDGVRRYGFHGLSYEYIARTLPRVTPEIAGGRVVVAHLGNGASMCALEAGRSIDSTMGFTALDGLPMGTRCGSLDPGVALYLIGQKGYSADDAESFLYRDCGLRGLSGISNDVRDLLASDSPGAKLALDYFVYRICQELGRLAASLGGLDAVVFTAGIGENSPDIRGRVCERSAWLGMRLDEAANRAGGPRISPPGSAVSAWVIPTDEEKMIALHTLGALRGRRAREPG